MGQELQIPASFKGKQMAQAFQQSLNATDDNLSEGIGQSYPVIGYKGKVWTLRVRGERKTIIRPDDGTPSGYLDVIILGQAKAKSKSYYKDFKDGDSSPPLCSSIDGIVPDAGVAQKQCESCALCPKNVWKTDANGRKGRECTDYKRLAVLILPTQTAPVMGGKALVEPCFLRVPPDSLNSLAIMGETMAAQGYHPSSYITRITFDPAKAHPCMVFRPLQELTDKEAPVILELRADPTVGRITGADIAAVGLHAVQQALAPSTVATGLGVSATHTASPTVQQRQPATPPTPPPAPPAPPAASSSGLEGLGAGIGFATGDAAPPATPSQATSAGQNQEPTGLVDTGFGGVSTASASAETPQPGLTTVEDVGEAEASDDELDARIAGLLTRQSS